jgi:hypothetical protein
MTSKASMAQPLIPLPPRPFPGLRAYQDYESRIMCGRLEHKLELLSLLETNRFLAVLGTSGSGKSSLVFAGLLPDILQGLLIGVHAETNIIIQTNPGLSPLANLINALAAVSPATKDVAGIVNGGAISLANHLRVGDFNLVTDQKKQPTSAVIYVDQFEELFGFIDEKTRPAESENLASTTCEDVLGQAQTFVRFLIECSKQTEFPIYVVLSMRSDFIWRCESFPGLAREVSRSQFHTARLERRQLEEAIRRPLKMYASTIEDDLVTTLLNQAPSEADQLPALQHVLFRLWKFAREDGDGRHLRLEDFSGEHIGEYDKSLEIHAAEVVKNLSETLQVDAKAIDQQVQHLFCTLASYSEKTQVGQFNTNLWVRRRIQFGELQSETGIDEARLRRLLDAFRDDDCCFLLPPKSGPNGQYRLENGSMIQVSHESIFRRWQTLAKWLAEERVRLQAVSRYHDSVYDSHGKLHTPVAGSTHKMIWSRIRDILLGVTVLVPEWLQKRNQAYLGTEPNDNDIGWGKSHGFDMAELHAAWLANEQSLKDNANRKMLTPILVVVLMLALSSGWSIWQKSKYADAINEKLGKTVKELSESNDKKTKAYELLESETKRANKAVIDLQKLTGELTVDKKTAVDKTEKVQSDYTVLTKQKKDLDDAVASYEQEKMESKKQFDFYTSRIDELIPELISRSDEAPRLKAVEGVFALAGPKILKEDSDSASSKPVKWMCLNKDANPSANMLLYEIGDKIERYDIGTATSDFKIPNSLPTVFSVNADGSKAVYLEGDQAKLLQWNRVTPLLIGPTEEPVDIVFDLQDSHVIWMFYQSGSLWKVTLPNSNSADQKLQAKPALKLSSAPTSQCRIIGLGKDCVALASSGKKGRLQALICDGRSVEMPASSVLRLPCALTPSQHLVSATPKGIIILRLDVLLSQGYETAIQAVKKLDIEGEITALSALDDEGTAKDQQGLLAIGTANPAAQYKGQLLVAHLPSLLNDTSHIPKVLPGNFEALSSVSWVKQAGHALLITADSGGQVLIWTKLWWQDTYNQVRYYEPRFASFGKAITDTAVSHDGKYLAVASLKKIAVVPLQPSISATAQQYHVHRVIKVDPPTAALAGKKAVFSKAPSPIVLQPVSQAVRQNGLDFWKKVKNVENIPLTESLRLVSQDDLTTGKIKTELRHLFVDDLNPEKPLTVQLNPRANFVAAQWNRSFTPNYFIKGSKVRVSRVDKDSHILTTLDVYPVDVIAEKITKKDKTTSTNPVKMTLSEGLVKALGLTETDTVLIEIPLVNR